MLERKSALRLTALSMRLATVPASFRISDSHTRITVQPAARRDRVSRRSRARFALILANQYSALCLSASFRRNEGHARPCQKSPSDKTTTLAWSITKSGQPGNEATFVLKRIPRRFSARPSSSSGCVPDRLFARFARDEASELGLSPVKLGARRLARCTTSSHNAGGATRARLPPSSQNVELSAQHLPVATVRGLA
jgi:hypothetical protein